MYAFILLNMLLSALNIIPRENKLHSTTANCLTWPRKTRTIRRRQKSRPYWLGAPRFSARPRVCDPQPRSCSFIPLRCKKYADRIFKSQDGNPHCFPNSGKYQTLGVSCSEATKMKQSLWCSRFLWEADGMRQSSALKAVFRMCCAVSENSP